MVMGNLAFQDKLTQAYRNSACRCECAAVVRCLFTFLFLNVDIFILMKAADNLNEIK